jgi:hypothetical protein
MSSEEPVTVPDAQAGDCLVLACRCGLLHTLRLDDDAGVARIDCVCGVVTTMPVGPPACGVGYPNNQEKQ